MSLFGALKEAILPRPNQEPESGLNGEYFSLAGEVWFEDPQDMYVLEAVMNVVGGEGGNIYPVEGLVELEVGGDGQRRELSIDFTKFFIQTDKRLPLIHDNPKSTEVSGKYYSLGISPNFGRLTPAEAVACGTLLGEISMLYPAASNWFQTKFTAGKSIVLHERVQAGIDEVSGVVERMDRLWPGDVIDGMHYFYQTLLMATGVREWILENEWNLPSNIETWAESYRDVWSDYWNWFGEGQPVLVQGVVEVAKEITKRDIIFASSRMGLHRKRGKEVGIDWAAGLFTQVFKVAAREDFGVYSDWLGNWPQSNSGELPSSC